MQNNKQHKKNAAGKGGGPSSVHGFRNIREMVCLDQGVTPPAPLPLNANSTATFVIAPFGIYGAQLKSGPTLVTNVAIDTAHFKWLLTTAVNFQEYRITRASVVVVGTVPSTATGNFTVASSKSYTDILAGQTPSYANSGPGVAVATLASKDYRVPITVDTKWKIVSNKTVVVNSDSITFAPVNTVDDLSCCSVAISNNSTQALGIAYLDYDVEFRGPINPSLNV